MSELINSTNWTPSPVTDDDIKQIGTLIYKWTGMIFGANKRYYIERRLVERMTHRDISKPRDYLDFAKHNLDERQALINAFTINETYFYREEHQLTALSRQILPEVVRNKRPGDLVRIWSMPCSTGEEGYSIALWLLENWPIVDAYNVEIIGSDVDTAAIALAQAGLFSSRSLARLPKAVLDSYFEPEKDHRRKIIDDLRESVRFMPANIIDRASLAGVGQFDVILCRNLLIYFDDESRLLAADNMHACLNDGGYLCLGHSESMSRISNRFNLTRLEDAIVYRKT